MAGIKISALPVAATLNVADLFEVSQSIASVQTSGKVTLAALATFLGSTIVGSIDLASVLFVGNTSSGMPLNMNDDDEIQLGDSRYGVLMYKSASSRLELKNTNSADYLHFLDAGGTNLSSTGSVEISSTWGSGYVYLTSLSSNLELNHSTGITSLRNTTGVIELIATGAINLSSNAAGVNLATTTNYLSVLEGVGIVSATNANATGFSIGEATNIFRLFASTELRLDAATTTLYQLTANTVPYLGASKEFVSSAVTPTELGYVSGVTSALQTQINALQTGQFWKQACRVATTVAGTLATDFENGDTIDGVVLATNDRILIKDQASAVENGIYVVNASGAPTRATDFDAQADNLSGATVTVQEGTANAEKKFTCSTNNPITIGVTNITFVDAGGLAYLGTTNRITVTGNVIDISASYVGQASITTLGTIGTGVWNGTSITTSYTDAKIKGAIAATAGLIPYGNATADTVTSISTFKYLDSGAAIGLGVNTTTLDTWSYGTAKFLTLQTTTGTEPAIINIAGSSTGPGAINFGNATIRRASIQANNGSSLNFYTNSTNSGTSLTERMSISSAGVLTFGTSAGSSQHIFQVGSSATQIILREKIGTTTQAALYIGVASGSESSTNYTLNYNGNLQINSQSTTTPIYLKVGDSSVYAITPTNSSSIGHHVWNQRSRTSLTASTAVPSYNFGANTQQWATGTLATQYFAHLLSNTVGFVGASTATFVSSLTVEMTTRGTNATFGTSVGIYVPTLAYIATTTAAGIYIEPPTGATTNWSAIFTGNLNFSTNASKIEATGTGSNGLLMKNLKNSANATVSGTAKTVEIDIAGTPYYFLVYPTSTA